MNLTNEENRLAPLIAEIGFEFSDISLLRLALTHSSYRNEMKSKGIHCECNERLEFLGDSVVSLVVSNYIYREYPNLPEGELSRLRAAVVCEHALAGYARSISLGDYMLFGVGEAKGNGRDRESNLEDAFEALAGAIYLDGGYQSAEQFVLRFAVPEVIRVASTGRTADHKTLLQQFVQKEPGDILEYVLVGEEGPPHNRTFSVEARLNNNIIGRGRGHSKREAEQMAASEALKLFGAKE